MKKQPWSPADATEIIRKISNGRGQVAFTRHASERMRKRRLIMGDVLYVLKNGFVHDEPVECEKTPGFFKYAIESTTPNSNGRTVRVIVIPDPARGGALKIVTVMWKD